MSTKLVTPDYLFEVSWEVCNKMGGIHTVISTKANSTLSRLNDQYMVIGPDVWRDSKAHPEFVEDESIMYEWKKEVANEGLVVRTGRWKIEGDPIAILVDYTPLFNKKDEIFKQFWELYHLDSISGQWDYIEPTLFGYAAGQIIENFIAYYGLKQKKVVAHFHEWMTGAGLLYLNHFQPQVGTVFTTHATVVGRSVSGNNQALYKEMTGFNAEDKARELNVISKHSAEKNSAQMADVFTTVSAATARECEYFLGKNPDVLTPNGFEDRFVPKGNDYKKKRQVAREKLLRVASALTGDEFPEDSILIATSGRYEYRNKGIDLFVGAMGLLNKNRKCERKAVAFVLIPSNQFGPRKDLLEVLNDPSKKLEGERYLTHYLHYAEHDGILNGIVQNGIENNPGDPVKVIFVPSYLKGDDGIFDLDYYDLLVGFDLTVFASYYEPWGYTPLESLAFSIPTVTTSLTGFGQWVNEKVEDKGNGITVVPRDENNNQEVIDEISRVVCDFNKLDASARQLAAKQAFDISRIALWSNLINNYWEAYSLAIERSKEAEADYYAQDRVAQLPSTSRLLKDVQPIWRRFTIQQNIPEKLKFLEDLSRNLWWSWNKDAVDLFRTIDEKIWEEVHENPILLLERMSYEKLQKLGNDSEFLKLLKRVHSAYDEYMNTPPRENIPSIAYFSMEFGLHNSLKIYSGGLGLLAGDYLKEASDFNYTMSGIGILYRYGYFRQVITSGGAQIAYDDYQDFSKIPAVPVKDKEGNWVTIDVILPGRPVHLRIWKIQVGRVPLYLLDADFEDNRPADRQITHKLYGGDHENRFKQELILGIGGVRALRKLGIKVDLYHLNEGHAAFTGLERLREYLHEHSMTFPEAREIVRATSLFTTHTPVPAGHDSFDENMMRTYLSHYPDRLTIDWNRFMNMGRENHDNYSEKFSMSVLAVNLSQEVNGVSRLHGQVSREMFANMWKGYMAQENHIGYVTNGVHLSTWLADSWRTLYTEEFGSDFLEKQEDRHLWKKIRDVKDENIWKIRNEERRKLIEYIRKRLSDASSRFMEDPKQTMEISETLDEKALTIGFARRFATYKRAHLLFRDIDRLAEIVNNPERPIQFVFAGKAHPNDIPGQDLIKKIVEISKMPQFIGKIIFLQNYNIRLAKKLLHGVDIWLNTPTRPLEASGTSGEKAVMNGGLHFSVLDGWWAEGYRENAGWALPLERSFENQEQQDELDAERIYFLLENEIAPKYYTRGKDNVPKEWTTIIKNSISEIAPEFTMNRMLRDYIDRYYSKMYSRYSKLKKNDYRLTREISVFKKQILEQWESISVVEFNIPDTGSSELKVGQELSGTIRLDLNGINPENIGVEMVMIEGAEGSRSPVIIGTQELANTGKNGTVAEYKILHNIGLSGQYDVGFRIYPKMEYLAHRMDLALVRWI